MTTRAPILLRPSALAALLTLLAVGCAGDDPDSQTSDTGTETAGDGDGDPTGDGDGEPTGDGDGDPTTTGDGDGDPGCTSLGCACSGDTCDAGLACLDGFCEATVCGDGEIEGDEECEDGNQVDGDGCDNDCTFTRVAQVYAGQHHTCARIDGGALRCWGRGEFGQLGYGNTDNVGDDEFPSDVGDVPLPGPVAKLALGAQHTCGIFADGGMRCWGLNDRGQLGYGNLNNFGDNESLANLPPLSVPPAIEVVTGGRHTCARVGTGEVRCWGANDSGELGYANTFVPTPEMLLPGAAVDIAGYASGLWAGFAHSCVRYVDGGIRCWGRNDTGQLGYGNLVNIGDDEVPAAVGLVNVVPPQLPANSEVAGVALGANHSCVLLGGGEILCWGANGSGQLGYGDVVTTGDDELPSSRTPVAIGGAAKAVVTGYNHTCALRTDGSVVCWGDNTVGQLGLGNTDNLGDDELPDTVGPIDLGGVAVQLAAGGNHTCALMADAEVRCWGQNNFSQLGLGSSVTVGDNETPAEVEPVRVLE